MNTLLLLLLDSRAPAGAHHHSGGMEAAIGTGLVSANPVRGLADLEDFCRARLRTSARVAAAFAAAAGRLQSDSAERAAVPAPAQPRAVPAESMAQEKWAQEKWAQEKWAELDAEFEARTPSEATRMASRQLGGGLLRLLRSVLPDADLVTPWTLCPDLPRTIRSCSAPGSAWRAAPPSWRHGPRRLRRAPGRLAPRSGCSAWTRSPCRPCWPGWRPAATSARPRPRGPGRRPRCRPMTTPSGRPASSMTCAPEPAADRWTPRGKPFGGGPAAGLR